MYVCHIALRMCTRVVKQTMALQEAGHEVEVCTRQAFYASETLDGLKMFISPDQLARTIRHSNADIFHVHNEGDWLVKVVKEAAGGRQVVFDCHDLRSLEDDELVPSQDEIDAFTFADGFCHVSHGHKGKCEERHGNSKPTIVLPSYINKRFLPQLPLPEPHWKAICYEGGVSIQQAVMPLTAPDEKGQCRIQVDIRALHNVVKEFSNQGYLFHLFSAEELPMSFSYTQVGGVLHDPLPYPTLLLALKMFGFGFCGATYPVQIMEVALPNKLFEYMSQGVVPVVWNSLETAKFVKEHDVGIGLESLDDLPRQLERGPELRGNILAKREEFMMENHIHELVGFYEELLNGRHKG